MATSSNPGKNERLNTYFVQDKKSGEELARLTVQDRLMTMAMGGVLAEQDDPARFRRVLDVGCGTGGWTIEAAQTYPTMELTGIDISGRMIEYARARAEEEKVNDRTEFRVMDALLLLEFPPRTFDLVNMRFGFSFLRTWEWPKLLSEMVRVTGSGGVIRLTEADNYENVGPAQAQLYQLFGQAFYKSGHLFGEPPGDVVSHLPGLLAQQGCKQVQSKTYTIECAKDTPQGALYIENASYTFRTAYPFLQKWGAATDKYDQLYQQMLEEMQQPDFCPRNRIHTIWGIVS